MKVAKSKAVTGVGLLVSGLLLALVTCKPVERQTTSKPIEKQIEDSPELADNSFCYVCHINYQGEKLVLDHELFGVGCANCHGESDAHVADEDGFRPPELMYSKAKINPFCMVCHARSEIVEQDWSAEEWTRGCPLLSGTATHAKYCTDCHGKHRLEVRTRRWDKDTGKLIWSDGVSMYDVYEQRSR